MRTSKTVSRKAFANNTFRRVAKVLQTFQAPLSYPARRRLAILPGLKNLSVLNLRILCARAFARASDWDFVFGKDITGPPLNIYIYQEVINLM